jgi:mRNA interferase HigB
MKIVKPLRLREYARHHSGAAANLERWITVTKAAAWTNFIDVRSTFGSSADAVEVASGRNVIVFNIAGNKFRLITAIPSYKTRKVFVLRFLTHAEYNKGKWKEEL